MNRLKANFNKVLDWLKFKEKPNAPLDVPAFVNKPIQSISEDLVGFDTHINAIKTAINSGANTIGIISDYGAGKSSLTELLALDDKNYCTPIKVNLWDSLCDTAECVSDSKAVKLLTKSFLFQLASENPHFASHINKILSKNYGTLSFSASTRTFWMWLFFSAVLYLGYLFLGTMPFTFHVHDFAVYANGFFCACKIHEFIRPLFLLLSIALAINALSKASVAFSLWDSQGKREPEINDVFDVYSIVVKKLSKRHKGKKVLIFIDDLDRISNKKIVVNFLRELYRFSNLIEPTKARDKFVFIVSVKPESMLKVKGEDKNDSKDESDFEDVYSKIFDYTINLKPIHNENYQEVILNLIKDINIKDFIDVDTNADTDTINKKFIDSCEWIMTGSNLTIRDLKQRLNSGLLLYQSIKSKQDGGYVNLKKCMAISYLEHAYPKEYYILVANEVELFKRVNETYQHRHEKVDRVIFEIDSESDDEINNEMEDEIVDEIASAMLSENQCETTEFAIEVARMLVDGVIDNDFGMYLYSYPKGAHIKTADEKIISNYIELPYWSAPDDLNEIIKRAEDSMDSVILNSYASLSKRDLLLPRFIFENERLFVLAVNNRFKETLELMVSYSGWKKSPFDSDKRLLRKISSYNFDKKGELLYEYATKLLDTMINSLSDDDVTRVRTATIEAVGENIVHFSLWYTTGEMPIISEDEMQSDNISLSTKLKLVNCGQISDKSIGYIYDEINKSPLSQEDYETQNFIYNAAVRKGLRKNILAGVALKLLATNSKIDIEKFTLITGICILYDEPAIEDITNYLQKLKSSELPLEYLENIDVLLICDNLSDDILNMLKNNRLYCTYLLCLAKQDRLGEVDVSNAEILDKVIAATEKLIKGKAIELPQKSEISRVEEVKAIRTHILNFCDVSDPKIIALFTGDYPIITCDNLKQIFRSYIESSKTTSEKEETAPSAFSLSLDYIDFSKLTTAELADSFVEYVNYVTSQNVHMDEGSDRTDETQENTFTLSDKLLFLSLFSESIKNAEVVTRIFENLDFDRFNFHDIPMDELETLVEHISDSLGLSQSAECCSLMRRMGVLIESLERDVLKNGLRRHSIDIEEYIDLINHVVAPTQCTMEILGEYDVKWGLSKQVTDAMFKFGMREKAVIGETLENKRFEYSNDKLTLEEYLNLYINNEDIYEYMKENKEFLDFIIDQNHYDQFQYTNLEEKTKPFYKCNLTIEFITFLFDNLNNDQIKEFLISFEGLKTNDDSIKFSQYMLENGRSSFLSDDDVFGAIAEKLWDSPDGHKGDFIAKRNELFDAAVKS